MILVSCRPLRTTVLVEYLRSSETLFSLRFRSKHSADTEKVLVFAMALSYGVGDYIEGGVLTAVIFLNCSIGFFQEFQAEKNMDSLRALSSPNATVLRDGKIDVVPR
jgi:magnesium-transporting ATPase (P-type)